MEGEYVLERTGVKFIVPPIPHAQVSSHVLSFRVKAGKKITRKEKTPNF